METIDRLDSNNGVIATIGNELPIVLVFDTDLESRIAVAHALRTRFRTQGADTVERALGQWRSTRPALVLVDLVLEGGSGLEVLVAIRRTSQVPVIVLSNDSRPETCVLALRFGADDFVVRPFDLSVLEARIDAVIRRSSVHEQSAVIGCADHLKIDVDSHQVFVYDDEVRLTRIEFRMLAHLALNTHQVFTREQLLEAIWLSRSDWQAGATVTEHMRRLRTKLGPAADHIKTVYGRGYRFDVCTSDSTKAHHSLAASF